MRILLVVSILLVLPACGGGGSGGGVGHEPEARPPEVKQPEPEPQPWPDLKFGVEYGPRSVSRSEVVAFMRDALNTGLPVVRHEAAPVLRVAGGTSGRDRQIIEDAVAEVNGYIHPDFRVQYGPDVPAQSRESVPNGEIWIDFAPKDTWEVQRPEGVIGHTLYHQKHRDPANPALAAHVWIDSAYADENAGRNKYTTVLVAHEILHALGVTDHAGANYAFSSTMHKSVILAHTQQPGRLLFRYDRAALEALYGSSLKTGDQIDDLGPWRTESWERLAGEYGPVRFGVDEYWRFPWVEGPMSTGNLPVTGTATWRGHLLGYSIDQVVGGRARLALDLESMTGDLDFTELEAWSDSLSFTFNAFAGRGATWGDGDLSYTVEATDNTFRNTGGDTGSVEGAFYGAGHKVAAGTLERHDLTAAFGATR